MSKNGSDIVLNWVKSYRANGHSIFDNKSTNNKYSKEFKEMVVQEYLQGLGSTYDLAVKYGIPEHSTVLNWINKYNSHRELKDYIPKPEVYMANTLKVSREKKIEIVKYCIDHNHDYKGTAEFYGGNYAQIYNWVKKYESKGGGGLEDRRGKRKSREQLTDLEKAQQRIAELERINRRQEMGLELLKKDEAFERTCLASLPKAKRIYLIRKQKIKDYSLIQSLHSNRNWPINEMCSIMNISRSAYYKWLQSSPSPKQIDKQHEDERITARIKEISNSNNSLFGTMTMYYTLRNEGYGCGHNRVYRLMCINDIKSSYRRRPRYKYIKSNAEHTAENILNRDFNTTGPNQKWCTDVTEIKVPVTGEKLFISPMIDLYDRFPVSLEVSDKNDTILVNQTLDNAHGAYPEATPLIHSDRGFAYTRQVYKSKLDEYGMSQSMSRVSKCIDNGVCEGFQGQFKDMLFILYLNISSKDEMREAIKGTLNYYVKHYPQKRAKG
ncbi:hypothetical protein B5E48_05070 [Massilimicrobiota sp. An105]|uniref:IS3 family transposase n=1 Tax=Massilimicrobiota sp. An105 TaxID=1965540 RepID=UPI000B36B378|nr:IS3 family transposase [Massilimicrobiota sp. An105]OUQ80755.1 hypothetical protein B5E48_05070 [Massilimicrobiota sp. An105]